MSRQRKPGGDADLKTVTILLAGIFIATTVGMLGVSLLIAQSISTGIWISIGVLGALCLGCWWYYKSQVDAEQREASEARQARMEKEKARQEAKQRKSQRRE